MNVAGGVRIDEPAIDLPVALALASSFRDRVVAPDVIAFGEIGLAGEVRGVTRAGARLAEAAAMGFRRAIVPVSAANERRMADDLEIVGVKTLGEALDAVL